MYKAILITGPRQSGKTTFLQNHKPNIELLNFDDPSLRSEIINSPNLFFKNHSLPIALDEVQRAPEVFLPLKLQIDNSNKKAQCYLSGSQSFLLMKNVSDSLAGRLGIVKLFGLSQREKFQLDFYDEFYPTKSYIKKHKKFNLPYDEIWNEILRGGSPALFVNKDFNQKVFWQNYISEYLDRDVRDLSQIGNLLTFHNFMQLLATQVGNLLNISRIASDLKINVHTVEHYLSILEASNIIYLLRPYSNNLSTRLIKTPKAYFMDTGLLCYLLGWEDSVTLRNSPMAGHIFENYVISEILKSFYNALNNEPRLYFYRDKDMKEIDLIIEKNMTLYPIEIKKHADPSKDDIKHFSVLKKFTNVKIDEGAVISFYDRIINITDNIINIPVTFI
jgi:predicted AAA+ superfamily ATPase